MSKIKKLLIFIIFAIAICLIPKNVNAIHNLKDNIYKLNYTTLKNSKTLYCIDHGSPLNSWSDTYELVSKQITCTKGGTPYYTKKR